MKYATISHSADITPDARSILVVDDEPEIRDFMQMLLEDEGYRVAIAQNAREALNIARATSPDLVVSDISMPGGSGVELYHWLHQEHLAPRMIFMSAITSGPPISTIPFIEKPFDIDDLLETVSDELAMTG